MSEKLLLSIGDLARAGALSAAWRQWEAVGSLATEAGRHRARSIVDPEALILLSACLRGAERRLDDMLTWFAAVGSRLVSLQRLNSAIGQFPAIARDGIGLFARQAAEAGDRRWSRLVSDTVSRSSRRLLKGPKRLKLIEPPTLMLRFRAAFGVGAKPDIFSFLLGMRGGVATVKVISKATGYTPTAVRSAVREMALARLVQETADRPAGYSVRSKPWAELLELRPLGPEKLDKERGLFEPPRWRFWRPLFAFLASTVAWTDSDRPQQTSAYLLSSEARDLFEDYREAFRYNSIEVRPAEHVEGTDFLDVFRHNLQVTKDWLAENV